MEDILIKIIDYTPQYQPDFKRLNAEWISKFFTLEKHDLEQLDHPDIHILNTGGHIFIAVTDDGTAVGTTALVKNSDEQYELVKMAVTPAMQGRHVGRKLIDTAIERARELGAKRVFLETNTKLSPAINLYKSVGFKEMPFKPSEYARSDYQMILELA
jgi:N-acetylglutamate synthase-like GNAT family acetyltransferase